MEWDPTEFQEAIRRLQDRRGLSQNRLAAEAGFSQTTLNRWMQPLEGGNPAYRLTRPTTKQLALLAQVPGAPSYQELLRMVGYLTPSAAEQREQRPAPIESLANYLASAWDSADESQREAGMDAIHDAATAIVENVWRVHSMRTRRRQRRARVEPPDSGSSYRQLLKTA